MLEAWGVSAPWPIILSPDGRGHNKAERPAAGTADKMLCEKSLAIVNNLICKGAEHICPTHLGQARFETKGADA